MSDRSDVLLHEKSMELHGDEIQLVTTDDRTTIRLDADLGNLGLGGDGSDGDLVVRDGGRNSLIHLDGGRGPVDPAHVNVYLDGGSGDAALTGDLLLNSWGASTRGEVALSADHRLLRTAPDVDLDVGLDHREVQERLREARTQGFSRQELEDSFADAVDRLGDDELGGDKLGGDDEFERDDGTFVAFETMLTVGEEFDATRLENPEVRDDDGDWVALDDYVDDRVEAKLDDYVDDRIEAKLAEHGLVE